MRSSNLFSVLSTTINPRIIRDTTWVKTMRVFELREDSSRIKKSKANKSITEDNVALISPFAESLSIKNKIVGIPMLDTSIKRRTGDVNCLDVDMNK